MTLHRVSSVLALTQDMMMAVVEEQWDGLVEMQLKQDELLRQLFAAETLVFSDAERQDLLEVQRLNQEILAAAENQKSEVANELATMRQGKLKVGAYQAL